MLRKLSSPLTGWFDAAVACRSDVCVMPTSRSRLRRAQFYSLCLCHGWVVVVTPPLPTFHAETRDPSRWPHSRLLNPVESRWMGGLLPPS